MCKAMSQAEIWRNTWSRKSVFAVIDAAMQRSAFREAGDPLRKLSNLLGLFHEGEGEGGVCIGSLNLPFEFGGHLVESSDVFSNLLLVLLINDSPIRNAGIVGSRWNAVVAPVWIGTRLARASAVAFRKKEAP